MAKVIKNQRISNDIYLLTVEGTYDVEMGQFFMLRAWENDPLLSRPISIFDCNQNEIKFLYQVVGKGTKILSQLRENDSIELQGPYGNGFPFVDKEICLIGGGIGIAPLYLAAKQLKDKNKNIKITAYLGYREEAIMLEEFSKIVDEMNFKIGGKVTDDIDFKKHHTIFVCGPMSMMEEVYKKTKGQESLVYISMEKRMACGVGACLGCTCKTKKGNKRSCKDGPVFRGEDIFYE